MVWPISIHIYMFTALKGSHFLFLLAITAAGVVLCGGPKKSPRTSYNSADYIFCLVL